MQNKKIILLIIAIVALIIWRKKISRWLDSQNVPDADSLPAAAKTGADNLQSKLKGTTAYQVLNSISQELIKQKGYSKDLVDNAPLDQLMLNQSDFLLLTKPATQKILIPEPKAPNINTTDISKIKIKKNYLWWPEVMFEETPTFENFNGEGPCACGSCSSCNPKTFLWQ